MDNSHANITLDSLVEGRVWGACYDLIARIEPTSYDALIHNLSNERLLRKQHEIFDIFNRCKGDWEETLHVVLFRFLGGSHNRAAMERLAGIVSSRVIMRENSSRQNLEALLLGAAGLLDIYNDDDYVGRLKQEFDHMAAKHNLMPMSYDQWQFSGMYHNNHPTLRIAQIAACLHENRISMASITSCSTRRDIHNLFASSASSYWIEQVLTVDDANSVSPRIGQFKSDILGINLVVPIILAYSNYTESKELMQRAQTLLRSIPAEDNRYTRCWQGKLAPFKSAVESQAFIQLSTVYCQTHRCGECPLAKILTTPL
ncbi:MAG: DUF2851 family protein [Alistipes sp.]|nr:DUF2851 family protein [Alistipes sp.]